MRSSSIGRRCWSPVAAVRQEKQIDSDVSELFRYGALHTVDISTGILRIPLKVFEKLGGLDNESSGEVTRCMELLPIALAYEQSQLGQQLFQVTALQMSRY